jgi:hypothetical protein
VSKQVKRYAARFRNHPQISAFIEHCSYEADEEIVRALSQPATRSLLEGLDSVAIQLLSEILDEARFNLEEKKNFREAAYWDLVADRVKDEINRRN